jgi:hypothetical protein
MVQRYNNTIKITTIFLQYIYKLRRDGTKNYELSTLMYGSFKCQVIGSVETCFLATNDLS